MSVQTVLDNFESSSKELVAIEREIVTGFFKTVFCFLVILYILSLPKASYEVKSISTLYQPLY